MNVRKLWTENFHVIRAYAYRTTEGILAGHNKNPLYLDSDKIEDIADDAIPSAWETTLNKADQIAELQDPDPEKQKKRQLGFVLRIVRNCVRHAIRRYRIQLAELTGTEWDKTPDPQTERIEAILESLPSRTRETAEAFSLGLTPSQVAARLGMSEMTVYRHREALIPKLGYLHFCRELESVC